MSLPTTRILIGDVRERLAELTDESVHCVVTSPPYFGLRDYGVPGQIGIESTLSEYIDTMTTVFRDVRRVLRSDGVCWLNIGDSMRDKQLLMVPSRLALALQADGWWLRCDIIWHKPNPMPESVFDRPTNAHEHIFLLTKSARYWYDAAAVREPNSPNTHGGLSPNCHKQWSIGGASRKTTLGTQHDGANLRNVWSITPKPFNGAHFATFPPDIPRRCIKAGCPEGGVVLDPFFGSGTTGLVAEELGREWIGIELNPEYAQMAEDRIRAAAPLFEQVSA